MVDKEFLNKGGHALSTPIQQVYSMLQLHMEARYTTK